MYELTHLSVISTHSQEEAVVVEEGLRHSFSETTAESTNSEM